MKITTLLPVTLAFFALFSGATAQQIPTPGSPPAGASDKGPQNNDIKSRSIELERISREAKKPDAKSQPEPMPAAKFQEIKEDFEKIQRLQDEIIKAYSKAKQIDYAAISANAEEMNKSAVRLGSNLFPVVEEKKGGKKSKEQKTDPPPSLPQDLKSLIVDQDNTLASFVGNPMFTNPQVVSTADNAKAYSDLQRLIRLTSALRQEAGKAKE